MATTFAQRQTAANVVMRAGLGVICIAESEDFTLTKDPLGTVPTGGGKTPPGGETTPGVGWIRWTGIDQQAAYGL